MTPDITKDASQEYELIEEDGELSIICGQCGRRSNVTFDVMERHCPGCDRFHLIDPNSDDVMGTRASVMERLMSLDLARRIRLALAAQEHLIVALASRKQTAFENRS